MMYDSRSEWLDRKELEETEGRRRRSRRSHVTSITYSFRGHQVWNQGGLILRKHVRCRYIPAIFQVRGVHTSTATVTKPDTCLAGLCAVESETGRRNITVIVCEGGPPCRSTKQQFSPSTQTTRQAIQAPTCCYQDNTTRNPSSQTWQQSDP